MISNTRVTLILTSLILTLFSFQSIAQDEAAASAGPSPAVEAGEKIFKSNCASCHKVKGNLIGPGLYGAEQRWIENGEYQDKSGKEWLYEWVRNSQEVIGAGHPYANQLFEEWNKSVMTAFTSLSNEDIDNVLAYVEYEATKEPEKTTTADAGDGAAAGGKGAGKYTELFLYILLALLVLIALILIRVSSVLDRMVLEKQGEEIPQPVPFYKNKKLITTIGLLIFIYLGNNIVNSAIDLGRQQGYQPPQPIKFSHKLHAGMNQVDCQYCHSGADQSKHSNIPSANVCMNCHKGVQQGPQHGRKEITKIYAAIGWNPSKLSFIENYEEMPVEEARALYSKWLNDDTEKEYTEGDVDEVLAQVQEPIEWVRIHNLPDHVYFNHSQHVTAGQVECQTCHGPVEEMEVLYQHAPLSMGWCLSCHRETPVEFSNNDYYKTYKKFHDKIKEGEISKVTVEMIGGTECQKCHY